MLSTEGETLVFYLQKARLVLLQNTVNNEVSVRLAFFRDWSKSIGGGGGWPEHLEMWLLKNT